MAHTGSRLQPANRVNAIAIPQVLDSPRENPIMKSESGGSSAVPLGVTESMLEVSQDRTMTARIDIEEVLTTFYEIISGEKSERRDWNKFRALFYPGALLFPNSVTSNPTASKGIEIDEYISNLDHFLRQNDFFEQGSITQFIVEKNIASIISTYEAKRSTTEQPFKRGVNFVHFICVEGDWKITSMIWQDS